MKNSDVWKSELQDVYKHIVVDDCCEEKSPGLNKGLIIADDNDGAILEFVKENLHYPELKEGKRLCELTIDETWTQSMEISEENDNATEFWNKLVRAAFFAKNGLLILNISNIKAFSLCWHLKQFAKQEKEINAWCSDNITMYDEKTRFFNLEVLHKVWLDMRHSRKYTDEDIQEYVNKTVKEAQSKKLVPSQFKFIGYVLINVKGITWDEICEYAQISNAGEFAAMMEFYSLVSLDE